MEYVARIWHTVPRISFILRHSLADRARSVLTSPRAASLCAVSNDMDTAKAIAGWFLGHPRDSGGTPQRTKAARANNEDSDSGPEVTAAQRRDCENEERSPPLLQHPPHP